jgi:2-amino-4-hydroxy-6-hydroxymethyldihydropteridine diphosphokinase
MIASEAEMATDAQMSGVIVYLGLGTNLGDRQANLREAIKRIEAPGLTIICASSLYETEPVGYRDQPWFLNQVVAAKPTLGAGFDAESLLRLLLGIEKEMGRVRAMANGPRLIDIDLLLYGDQIIARPEIIVPHPRLHLRRFVLEPLCEIAPDLVHPAFGNRLCDMLAALKDSSTVRRLG